MTTLPIPVDDETAAAYESATPEERERAASVASALLKASLSPRAGRLDAFRAVADATGAEAQANGWTDELDAALLRGDFDHDE